MVMVECKYAALTACLPAMHSNGMANWKRAGRREANCYTARAFPCFSACFLSSLSHSLFFAFRIFNFNLVFAKFFLSLLYIGIHLW